MSSTFTSGNDLLLHANLKASSFRSKGNGKLLLIFSVFVILISITATAWPTIVPNSNATTEGNSGDIIPFGNGTPFRYQQIYAASEFSTVNSSGGLINGIAFRLDSNIFGPVIPLDYALRINLSTTSTSVDGLSTIFTNNLGPDTTLVFSSVLHVPAISSSCGNPPVLNCPPLPFVFKIPFTKPFFYNPNNGNLILDINCIDNRCTNGSDGLTLDAVNSNGSVSRLYSINGGSLVFTNGTGLVTQFDVNPSSLETVNDGNFNAWNSFSFVTDDPMVPGPPPTISTGKTTRVIAGGNPGAYLEGDLSFSTGDILWTGGIKMDYTYNPVVSGAIRNISVSADLFHPMAGTSTWQLVIEQAGQRYYSFPFGTFSQNSSWSTINKSNLVATNFDTNPLAGRPGGKSDGKFPDFGPTAASIRIGFLFGNQFVDNGTGTNTLGLDNLSVSFAVSSIKRLTVNNLNLSGGTISSYLGNISCGATCAADSNNGTIIHLIAIPREGYMFDGWGGACSGTGNSCTITMNASKIVIAKFTVFQKKHRSSWRWWLLSL